MWARYKGEEPHGRIYEEHKLILELLEQEHYYKDLAESYEKTINKLTKAIADQEPTTKNDLEVEKIEVRKPCINYEDGCEEWAGCPCVHYKGRK